MAPRLQVHARIGNIRSTIRREVDIVRDLVGDIRERVDANPITEPRSTRGKFSTHRGSLVKNVPDAVFRTFDNLVEHQQNFARINRKHLHRS